MALPAITSISPSSGPAGGGTTITIEGSGFTGATAVLFGGASATGIAVEGDTVVVATSPPGAGVINVSVTTPAGSSAIAPASQFSYGAAASGGDGTSSYYVDPGLSSQLVNNLLTVLTNTTSPDALEAQNIIMRRIALEGDVIGSRVPPPRNITEIGGYFNLLGTLKESAMREQALAGILGVAGPSTPLGWVSNTMPLAMVSVSNDRPAGPAQPSLPLTVLVRSDFVNALNAAIATIHSYGATLPLAGASVLQLPAGSPGAPPPTDMLTYLGRELLLAPTAALANPQTDPLALIRPTGTTTAFAPAANVLSAAAQTVTPGNYDAVACTATASSTVALTGASFVMLGPILATAGFYPASPFPVPANNTQSAWALLTNITGLVAGRTQLGDELSLLYNPQTIANSVFAGMLTATWNGTTFA